MLITIYFLRHGDFDAYDISMYKDFYKFFCNADILLAGCQCELESGVV